MNIYIYIYIYIYICILKDWYLRVCLVFVFENRF